MHFTDTSAVLKLYVPKLGTPWMLTLDQHAFSVSALAVPEVASALARRRREGILSALDEQMIWRAFQSDLAAWSVIRISLAVLSRAASLLRDPSMPVQLRTLDAVQLACCLEAERRAVRRGGPPLTLLTADDRLEAAARHVGLSADNPLRHA